MILTNLLSSLNPFSKTRKSKSKKNKIQRKTKMNKKIRRTKRRFMRGG